ncbi:MAG: intradiol ring-cleavage dioxygenase [Actinobacteria bacterium]|nr:intradiol ring-cleavage dioxygenase [Actinomycetota bacterium]
MDSGDQSEQTRTTRRGSLLSLGGLLASGLGGVAWKGEYAEEVEAAGVGPAAVAAGLVTCILTPEQTDGPFYIASGKIRRDIRDGHDGAVLDLRTTVVDAATCKPVKGALVEIWHCDAAGLYSGFGAGAASRTFLRGGQRTDAKGLARFTTIYPGWYQGRTVHLHVKVHIGGTVVHTGQLYFSDTVTDAVFRREPYRSRGGRTTRNSNDSIFRNGGNRSQVRLAKDRSGGYVATIALGVMR